MDRTQAAKKKGSSRTVKPRLPRSTKQTGSSTSGKMKSALSGSGGTRMGAAPPTGGGPPSGTLPPTAEGGEDDSYRRTSNIQQAEDFARSLGIGVVRYTDPHVNQPAAVYEIANNTNEALKVIRSRGIRDVPKRVETNRLYFIETNARGLAWAVYVHNASLLQTRSLWQFVEAIVINPRPEWVDVGQEVTRMHQVRYLSTGDPHHFVYHEYGHFLWRRDNARRHDPDADRQAFHAARARILAHVGSRALQSVPEFIAEVFAKLIVGAIPLELQVEQLYRQLGGRMV